MPIGQSAVIFIKFRDGGHSRAWCASNTALCETSQPCAREGRSMAFRSHAFSQEIEYDLFNT
jgi:hypothetical protein